MTMYACLPDIVKRFAAVCSPGGYAEPFVEVDESRPEMFFLQLDSRSAQLGPMKTSKAVDRDATNRDERFSTNANSGKTLPRPASYATITYPYHGQQDPSQQGRIPQLVLAMAALRLENTKTEEMIEKEYEVLDPSSTAALDEDYVLVTSDCDYVRSS